MRRPRTSITVGSGDSSRETSLYGLRIGSTCSTPAKPSSGSVASSSRSPIAPITVASRPGRDERRAAGLVEARDDLVDLILGGARAHHDQQLGCAGDGHRNSLGRITLHGRSEPATEPAKPRVFSGIQPTGREDARQLQRRLSPVRRRRRGRAKRSSASSTCTRSPSEYDPAELRDVDARPRGDAVRDRPRRRSARRSSARAT